MKYFVSLLAVALTNSSAAFVPKIWGHTYHPPFACPNQKRIRLLFVDGSKNTDNRASLKEENAQPTIDDKKDAQSSSNETASKQLNHQKNSTDRTEELKSLGLRVLYPPLPPNANGTLQVDSIHTLYYEEYGRQTRGDDCNNVTLGEVKTALFLHGGPGAGCYPNHARFFDPDRYRIVLLDQRGSGRSTPRGEIRNNTLLRLVDDCELLRAHLGIQKWDVVMGGSWGSTLAIAYAQEFPPQVGALILRGACTLRSAEVDWLFSSKGGAAASLPDSWSVFESAMNSSKRVASKNENAECNEGHRVTLHSHYDQLMSNHSEARLIAAKSFFQWEMAVFSSAQGASGKQNQNNSKDHDMSPVLVWDSLTDTCKFVDKDEKEVASNKVATMGYNVNGSMSEIQPKLRKWQPIIPQSSNSLETRMASFESVTKIRPVSPIVTQASKTASNGTMEHFIPAQAMLTCFYSVNDRFAMDNICLLSNDRMARIQQIPCIAVQGALDRICTPDTALDLKDAWPSMELRIPLASGHSMYDPSITHELVKATDRLSNN
eukprot:scaffold2108_cov57-Attheya_sp.AAC.2